MPTPTRCDCTRCRAHDAGRHGPYTQADFMALGGLVEPTSDQATPSEAVQELSAAADVLRGEWEQASDDLAAAQKHETAMQSRHSRNPGHPEVVRAQQAASTLQARRDEIAKKLRAVKVAYHEAWSAECRKHRLEEYRRNVQAMETAAEERRSDDRDAAVSLVARVRKQLARA